MSTRRSPRSLLTKNKKMTGIAIGAVAILVMAAPALTIRAKVSRAAPNTRNATPTSAAMIMSAPKNVVTDSRVRSVGGVRHWSSSQGPFGVSRTVSCPARIVNR